MIGFDYLFGEISQNKKPFDYETFVKSPIQFTAVVTNCQTGETEYIEKEAKEHPRKNVLMKALGAQTTVEMDVFAVEDQVESIMLCSDGLTNMLDFEQINKVLTEDLKVEEKVQKLICKSNNRGGTDNISVALLELEAKK